MGETERNFRGCNRTMILYVGHVLDSLYLSVGPATRFSYLLLFKRGFVGMDLTLTRLEIKNDWVISL